MAEEEKPRLFYIAGFADRFFDYARLATVAPVESDHCRLREHMRIWIVHRHRLQVLLKHLRIYDNPETSGDSGTKRHLPLMLHKPQDRTIRTSKDAYFTAITPFRRSQLMVPYQSIESTST